MLPREVEARGVVDVVAHALEEADRGELRPERRVHRPVGARDQRRVVTSRVRPFVDVLRVAQVEELVAVGLVPVWTASHRWRGALQRAARRLERSILLPHQHAIDATRFEAPEICFPHRHVQVRVMERPVGREAAVAVVGVPREICCLEEQVVRVW